MSIHPIQKVSFPYGARSVSLETGATARQATASVLVRIDQTAVLVTLTCAKQANPNVDFFPLSVHYQERAYASGRIPGGYFKREGRPSEKEILTARLIDRPMRPLFSKGFSHEVQVIATVLSSEPDISSDIPAMLGASAVLALSGLPAVGPFAAVRIGYIAGDYVLNPSGIL